MILDTGSSILWVRSTLCKSSACDSSEFEDTPDSHTFDYNESSTFVFNKASNYSLTLHYVTGSVGLIPGQDTVDIGSFLVPNQRLGLAYKQDYFPFTASNIDGIFGLGFDYDPSLQFEPPIIHMRNENIIKSALFCYYMNPLSYFNSSNSGEISIGEIDYSKTVGDPFWFSLKKSSYYAISLVSIRYGNETIATVCSENCKADEDSRVESMSATMDTGSTALLFPKGIMKKILARTGGFIFPLTRHALISCKDPEKLLPIVLQFQSINENVIVEYSIQPDEYVDFKAKILNYCISSIMASDVISKDGDTVVLLGEPFLSKFYSVWDLENKRFGLYALKQFSQ
jgi:hypothetical protein